VTQHASSVLQNRNELDVRARQRDDPKIKSHTEHQDRPWSVEAKFPLPSRESIEVLAGRARSYNKDGALGEFVQKFTQRRRLLKEPVKNILHNDGFRSVGILSIGRSPEVSKFSQNKWRLLNCNASDKTEQQSLIIEISF
jgi:hypothetical protein